jgi:hypothetical protein
MRNLLILASLLVASAAWAQDADAVFRDWATKSAASDGKYVEQWWSANLDADKALERVAVVCPSDANATKKGAFIIEKDATHRWEIAFDFDSKTKACSGKPAAPPTFEQRKSNVIELYQGHLQGHEITSYAIRVGQPVIVREVTVEKTGGKPQVKDWDQLVKSKKAKSYQSPDTMQPLS